MLLEDAWGGGVSVIRNMILKCILKKYGADWTQLFQGMVYWRTVLNRTMNLYSSGK
jgi:hypothetical protein